jgi:predicted dithiol-disulfide oxidoreductase (DUF899 family)
MAVSGKSPGWPGESAEYRASRDALARAEHDLARAVEAVAAQRRSLPPGGLVPENYGFTEGPPDLEKTGPAQPVTMDELFGPHETLLLYSFMYDGTGTPCRMCTSLIDGYDGAAADLAARVGFAVVAPAPLEALRAYGLERRWYDVRLVSSAGTSYHRDYGGMQPDGELTSRMNVFTRRDGSTRHFYATEKGPSGSGQDDRHLDLLWTLWGALDLTPEGRGEHWRPTRPARRPYPA